MSTIALQIGKEGIGWAVMATPDHFFDEPAENEVCSGFSRWRESLSSRRDRLPLSMEERVLVYQQVLDLLAVDNRVDRIRLGCIWVGLAHSDAYVREVAVHPEGAAGIMRTEIEEFLANAPPPGI